MLSIRVVSRAGEPPEAPLAATFGPDGGDIGRGADCTLVLPDPERRISRKHAVVAWRDGRAFLRQLGLGVPVELDGRLLGADAESPLGEGAEIRIGPYVLRADAPPPAPPALPVEPPPAAAPSRRAEDMDLLLDDTEPTPLAAAVEALYDGLGVPMPARRPSVDQTRLIGGLLRATVAGTLELLAARNIAKRELGANPTMLQVRQNNPLKFSPDVDAALSHLLGPAQRGFVAPLDAVNDAFDDLRAHELAVLAGMRAALDSVLARFDPAALEQKLDKSMWASVMPAARKARLWELHAEQYAQTMRDVENDFDSVFGRAFLQAYQAQLAAAAQTNKLNLDAPS
jgi:predicted component of type VI protein secretion system